MIKTSTNPIRCLANTPSSPLKAMMGKEDCAFILSFSLFGIYYITFQVQCYLLLNTAGGDAPNNCWELQNQQKFQVPKNGGFPEPCKAHGFPVFFPLLISRIHTAYIGKDSSIWMVPEMLGASKD